MAGKPEGKAAKQGGGVMPLIVKTCFALGLISMTVMLLAAIDFHLFDLSHALGIPALGALALFVICAALGGIAAMLANGAATRQVQANADGLASQLEARMKAVEDKFSSHLDAEMAAIKKERDTLQGELDKIHAAEEERRLEEEKRKLEEFELLKQQNLALQEQLRQVAQTMKTADAVPQGSDDGARAQAG